MRYKVGDMVLIKTWDSMAQEYGVYKMSISFL